MSTDKRGAVTTRLVIAPSGAGKTYYAKLGFLRDGDELPSVKEAHRQLNHTFGYNWWEQSHARPAADQLLLRAFRHEIKSSAPDALPIATAEADIALSLYREGALLRPEIAWFAPSPEKLTSQQGERAARFVAQGQKSSQPNWSFERNVLYLRQLEKSMAEFRRLTDSDIRGFARMTNIK